MRGASPQLRICLISHSSKKSAPCHFPPPVWPVQPLFSRCARPAEDPLPRRHCLFSEGLGDSIGSSVNVLEGERFPARTLALRSRSLLRQCPFLRLQGTAGTSLPGTDAALALRFRRTANSQPGSGCSGMSCLLPSWSNFEGFANQIPVWSRNQPCRGWYFQLNLSVHRAQTLFCFLK